MAHDRLSFRDDRAPGFRLVDDCGGRFVIDAETGVVTLSSESWLQRERGAVRVARIEVREQSGACYEIAMRLRLTGATPQAADETLLETDDDDLRAFSQGHWAHYAAFFAEEPAPREPADFAPAPLGEALAPVGEIPAPVEENLNLGEVRLALPPRARAEPLWALF